MARGRRGSDVRHQAGARQALVGFGLCAALSGCGLFFGYPNTNAGLIADAQNRRINDRERPTEPGSARLPTNNAAQGAAYDEPQRKADWQALKDLLFGPVVRWQPYKGELPRCLEDEVYSCSVSGGCRCKLKKPPPIEEASVP